MKNGKHIKVLLIILALSLLLAACSTNNTSSDSSSGNASGTDSTQGESSAPDDNSSGSSSGTGETTSVKYTEKDTTADYNESECTIINLADGATTFTGNNVTVSGDTITITAAGNYLIRGTLSDGQIYVNPEVKDTVRLILDGVNVSNTKTAPMYMVNVKKVIITLAPGSVNYFSDAMSYFYENDGDNEPNGCIFSKGDITINGTGTLNVIGNYNNGIQSKDELKIISGTINVTAENNALKGKDFVAVLDGTINLVSSNDGIKSDNTDDSSLGFVYIDGGNITINAAGDGIQAETFVKINGGVINIKAGKDGIQAETVIDSDNAEINISSTGAAKAPSSTSSDSQKGLKAGVAINISSGTYIIDTTDDAIHSDGTITITGGEFTLTTGDDGIHADAQLDISGGNIDILDSYEGLESAVINISGGNIGIKASDDGINAAAKNTGTNNRPGNPTGNYLLNITGGYIFVNASGDGIDSNNNVTMSGGTLVIYGPTSGGDAAIDYDGNFTITGGTLFAGGSSQMAQMPGTSSAQNSVMIGVSLASGSEFIIKNSSGDEIFSITPNQSMQNIVFSSPELVNGSYTYSVNGTSSSFTVNSVTTTVNANSGGGFGGGGQQGGNRPGWR